MIDKYLNINPEVQKSIHSRIPVVALDSYSIFNNISYPKNIEISNNLSKIIRNNGCIPATIAIINGVLKIGLTRDEIEFISNIKNLKTVDTNELPYAILNKLTRTTTLASSIKIASLSNITIISTNNIESYSDIENILNSNISVIYNNINENLNDSSIKNYLHYKGTTIIDSNSYGCDNISNLIKIKSDLSLKGNTLISTNISSTNLNKDDYTIKAIYHNTDIASKVAKNLFSIKKRKFKH